MGWKVVIGLEIVASVATHKLSLLHLIGTLMRKSLISHAFFSPPSSIPIVFVE